MADGIPLHLVESFGVRTWVDGSDPDPNDADATHIARTQAEDAAREAFITISARQPARTDGQRWSDWWHEWSDALAALTHQDAAT